MTKKGGAYPEIQRMLINQHIRTVLLYQLKKCLNEKCLAALHASEVT